MIRNKMKEMKFSIGFDKRDLQKLHSYWDTIIESQQWTEAYFTRLFEEKWANYNNLNSVAFGSWSGAALAAIRYFKLAGETVLCPSNTFIATPLSIVYSEAKVQFVDCNKTDLCMSYDDFKRMAEKHHPAAAWVVHIGGHISFEIQKIADYCKENDIILLEDCAHAHGASWNGKRPGEWGDVGVYSFYPTKTISTGEGGMLVSKNNELIEFAKGFRNYGKPDFSCIGLNYKISEFCAAIGVIEVDRLVDIVDTKNEYALKLNEKYHERIIFPKGMISGYYKYIVFEEIEKSTGKVYDNPCHNILKHNVILPNTDWVSQNHWCVPIYYQSE